MSLQFVKSIVTVIVYSMNYHGSLIQILFLLLNYHSQGDWTAMALQKCCCSSAVFYIAYFSSMLKDLL